MAKSAEEIALRRGWSKLADAIRADWVANHRDPKARSILIGFRICQALMGDLDSPRVISVPAVVIYRLATEWMLGLELRPKTAIGPGLMIHHAYGLVVNDHASIGAGVTLRHGITIGHSRPGGASPVIHDGVDIGAGAIILGDITIGIGSIIGAGAVVLKSVPPNSVAVGNPATSRPFVQT